MTNTFADAAAGAVPAPLESPAFLFIWFGFLLLMSATAIAFFLWGIRSGQFADQDRARYLPLESGIPEPPTDVDAPSPAGGGAGRGKDRDEAGGRQPC